MNLDTGLILLFALGIAIWLGFLFVIGVVVWKTPPPGEIGEHPAQSNDSHSELLDPS